MYCLFFLLVARLGLRVVTGGQRLLVTHVYKVFVNRLLGLVNLSRVLVRVLIRVGTIFHLAVLIFGDVHRVLNSCLLLRRFAITFGRRLSLGLSLRPSRSVITLYWA